MINFRASCLGISLLCPVLSVTVASAVRQHSRWRATPMPSSLTLLCHCSTYWRRCWRTPWKPLRSTIAPRRHYRPLLPPSAATTLTFPFGEFPREGKCLVLIGRKDINACCSLGFCFVCGVHSHLGCLDVDVTYNSVYNRPLRGLSSIEGARLDSMTFSIVMSVPQFSLSVCVGCLILVAAFAPNSCRASTSTCSQPLMRGRPPHSPPFRTPAMPPTWTSSLTT